MCLVLEYERAFETNYLKALDNFDHERQKNLKLKEMSSRMELKSKESEIQNIIKQTVYQAWPACIWLFLKYLLILRGDCLF